MKEYWAPVVQIGSTVLSAVAVYLIRHLHHTINSKMDRLLEVTARAARAEGVLEEKTRRDAADDDRIRKTLT